MVCGPVVSASIWELISNAHSWVPRRPIGSGTLGVPDAMCVLSLPGDSEAGSLRTAALLAVALAVSGHSQCNTSSRTPAFVPLCGACPHPFIHKYLRSISHRPGAV